MSPIDLMAAHIHVTSCSQAMSFRLSASIFLGLVIVAIIGLRLWSRHDPWAFVRPIPPTQRVAVYDQTTPRNPGLIVDGEKVELALFRPGSCKGCDTGWPVPTDSSARSAYFDVHISRDSRLRARILDLLAPMHGYAGKPGVIAFARSKGFHKVAARKPIPCLRPESGGFVVLDWGNRADENDVTIIQPGCASRETDAALARITKAFQITAEATNTAGDPRSRFSMNAIIAD